VIVKQMVSRRWILPTILVIIAAMVCVRLGIWQLDRLSQRRASNAHYIAMQAAPPLSLPLDSPQNLPGMEFRAVTASGHYDFSEQVALRNQDYHDQYGYHLLTPLVLPDGTAVFVDRGWIPAQGNADRIAWSSYDVPPDVTVNGIIRRSRVKADLGGETDPALSPGQTRLDTWLFPNLPRIQQQISYRLLPIYIQLNPVATADPQPPIPDQPVVDLTEGPHESYAIQWFSFAAILLVGYPFYVRRHPTNRKSELLDPEAA
jgi:surfeit locus 1 family protein